MASLIVVFPDPFAPKSRLNLPGKLHVRASLPAARNPSTVSERRCTQGPQLDLELDCQRSILSGAGPFRRPISQGIAELLHDRLTPGWPVNSRCATRRSGVTSTPVGLRVVSADRPRTRRTRSASVPTADVALTGWVRDGHAQQLGGRVLRSSDRLGIETRAPWRHNLDGASSNLDGTSSPPL